MSDTVAHRMTLRERASGKWQIPALCASTILLATVALQVKSPTRKIGIDGNLDRINQLISAQLFVPALNLTRQLLTWEDLHDQDRSTLHVYAARATFERAKSLGKFSEQAVGETLEHYKQAIEQPYPLDASDHRRIAVCHETLGQRLLARTHYQAAANQADPPALADKVIELGIAITGVADDETEALLASFCDEADGSLGDLIWALEQRVNLLERQDNPDQIEPLLNPYEAKFAGTSTESSYRFLQLLGLRGVAKYDEAELGLRALLNDIEQDDAAREKSEWLLGSVVLSDGGAQRPEEALSIFRNVIVSKQDRTYVAASMFGMAEASALMQRFDDAIAHYTTLVREVRRGLNSARVTRAGLLAALSVSADLALSGDDPRHAIEFLELAEDLVRPDDDEAMSRVLTRLGQLQAIEAKAYLAIKPIAIDDEGESASNLEQPLDSEPWDATLSQKMFDAAGATYVKVAWLSTLNEERAGAAMWTAAGLFDEGGNHERAIQILRAFVRDRSDADIIPRVLLRLGRSLQAAGRYEEAVEAYQRNISSHPRSPYANAALIPLAECFLARGGEFEAQAESALLQITRDSEIFTPAAIEFRDALFLLGDLYGRQAAYERAIPVFEEVLERYSDDPRRIRTQFLLADAYRQSALAIKEEVLQPEFVAESKRLRFEIHRRFSVAAGRFRKLIDEMTPGESSLDELGRVYLQDARLFEASCLFELGRFKEALALYERAAWIYKDRPAALGAYVQVINCNILLENTEEAASALRRAQFLVGSIAEERFSAAGELETRESWRQHFEWVAEVLADG
ncbi:MAG: tetratricopeptide repeat protein [Planctomycetes bacterium]|nr:tetratricopeptide repeat protein [Planctomycetota bacterium]